MDISNKRIILLMELDLINYTIKMETLSRLELIKMDN